jgi:predicted lipoprotein with Yx(FWY)xxD motif
MKKRPRKSMLGFALPAVIGALAIAGCGGGSSNSTAESGSAGGNAVKAGNAGGGGTIGTAEIEGLGPVLVDSSGMTVYEYTPDKSTTSTCYGECESFWPPVVAEGKPTAGEGAMSSALGTTERKDGTMQVTYNGHPLYTFSKDSEAGEANGQEFEGIWFVLNESGSPVKGQATGGGAEPATEESESSGGYGY